MPNVKTPEEMPVQRLPVYSRAEADLFHWSGKLLVPRGQMITPDLVAALLDAKIAHVYLDGCKRADTSRLQQIDVFSVEENAPLPFAVFDSDGLLLAREGERLSTPQLDTLHRRGQKKIFYYRESPAGQAPRFQSAYTARIRARLDEKITFGRRQPPKKGGIPLARLARVYNGRPRPKPTLDSFEAFYSAASNDVQSMWTSLASGKYLRNTHLAPLANDVLERFLSDREILAALALSELHLPLYPSHGLATAVYSLFIARALGYNQAQARDLIVASIFHDVGYTMLPEKLLDAERPLSKIERSAIFRHIDHALFLLARVDWPGDDFQIAIYQHHERGTGAGYPSGYRSDDIHQYSSIIAVADVFHALVSNRPHRAPYLPSEAMKLMLKMGAVGLLDRSLVRTLALTLSVHPVGSCLILSTGETVRVVAASSESARPYVGAIFSPDGERLKSPLIIDLSKRPDISVRAEVAPFEESLAGF